MTRIGVMSDSHGSETNVISAAWEMKSCDTIIHLGDHAADADALNGATNARVRALAGNCDWFSDAPAEVEFDAEGVHVFATHGHREGVKNGMLHLSLKAQSLGASLVLFGHTHLPSETRDSGIVFLNPGALRDGRYAIVEIDGRNIRAELKRL